MNININGRRVWFRNSFEYERASLVLEMLKSHPGNIHGNGG